jgi:hypothetical protein
MEKRLTLFLIALLVLAVFVAGCSETAGQAYQKTVYARQKAAANLQAAPVEYQALPATQNANLQYAGPSATYTAQQPGAVANVAPAPVTATTIPAGSVAANQGYVSPGAYANVGGSGSGTGVANTASNALSPFEGTIVSSVCEDSVTYVCDGNKLVKKTVRTCTQVSQCQQTCSNGACGCTPEKKVVACQGSVQTIQVRDAQCQFTTAYEVCPNNQVCINNACGTPTGQCTPACSNTQTCQNGVCVERTPSCPPGQVLSSNGQCVASGSTTNVPPTNAPCPSSKKVCLDDSKYVSITYAFNGKTCVESRAETSCTSPRKCVGGACMCPTNTANC